MDPNVDALLWNGRSRDSAGTDKVYGVVPAIVVAIHNPGEMRHRLGMVQIRFPCLLDEGAVQDILPWARCVTFASGQDGDQTACGWVATPQIGDEVLVGFENGDIRFPCVLGQLYNPLQSKPKPDKGGGGGGDGGGGDARPGAGGGQDSGDAAGQDGGGAGGGAAGAGAGQADQGGAGAGRGKGAGGGKDAGGGGPSDQAGGAAPDAGPTAEQAAGGNDDKEPAIEKRDLRVRLRGAPGETAKRKETFTLTSGDGSVRKRLTIPEDGLPGDKHLDLLFPALETSKRYSLQVEPGKPEKAYFLFKDVPFAQLS